MNDKINDNWNAIMYIPPIIITIINCIFQDAWYLFIMIIPITMVWCLALMGFIVVSAYFKPKIDKKLIDEIIIGLNIEKKNGEKALAKKKIYCIHI